MRHCFLRYKFIYAIAMGICGTLMLAQPMLAQERVVLAFPDVPCDSTACLQYPISGVNGVERSITSVLVRNGINFFVPPDLMLPIAIPPGDTNSVNVPVCLSPIRRGNISDSLVIIVSDGVAEDTIRIRLTGKGIGADITVDPTVLNFPKTNPPATATLQMKFTNNGERPYTITPAMLTPALPFRIVTPLPITILPGEEEEIEVEFAPEENGIYSIPTTILAGCTRQLQLVFNGATDIVGTGAVVRTSKIDFNPLNNQQIPCDISQCTELVITNAGNAQLNVESLDWLFNNVGYTFNPTPSLPFSVAPNTSSIINVCLNSQQAGLIQDTLIITTNNRNSTAFGVVIDVSGSMRQPINCVPVNSTRIVQAELQAKSFINNTLLHIPSLGIQDQIVICTYSDETMWKYPLTDVTDQVRQEAQASINGLIQLGTTNTGRALIAMIDTLAKSPLDKKVIVLLTDGEARDDGGVYSKNAIVDYANLNGVQIFSIGLALAENSAITYINRLSTGTGGVTFEVDDCGGLQGAFETITDLVSSGSITYEPFAIKVTSPVLISNNVTYDSTLVSVDTCIALTLTNVGEGNAVVNQVQFNDLLGVSTSEFYLDPDVMLPLIIEENSQVTVDVCFRPEGLRQRGGQAIFNYNDCSSLPVASDFYGIGYAYANLRIDDEKVALPGSTVTMPVYGDSALLGYEVLSIDFQVKWNNTMLDMRGITPGAQANGAGIVVNSISENGRYSIADISINGDALQQAGELAVFEFYVLRGDTLASTIELVEGAFEDGNPRILLKNSGLIAYDSTCFRDYKPVFNRGAAAKIAIGEPNPVPVVNGTVRLPVTSDKETELGISLFAADGAMIFSSRAQGITEGEQYIAIDVQGLAAGNYYVQCVTEAGQTVVRKILLAR